MLNELAIVVRGLKNAGISFTAPNPRIQSVGKKKNLLVVRLNAEGKPDSIAVNSDDETAVLRRYVQNPGDKATPSFPAFNLPTPFRNLLPSGNPATSELVKQLAEQQKAKATPIANLTETATKLLAVSQVHGFKQSDDRRFRRCTATLAGELASILGSAPSELTNLKLLAETITKHPLTLKEFVDGVSQLLARPSRDVSREQLLLFQKVLFGQLDWRKRQAELGTEAYFTEKADKDEGGKVSLYLELAKPNPIQVAVSHPKTWEHLNILLEQEIDEADGEQTTTQGVADAPEVGIDAFTGEFSVLEDRFAPAPLVRLGPFKPFSLNTVENKCLLRYGLRENASFPVSRKLAREFYNALRHLASDERLGVSCKPIKNGRVKRVQGKTIEDEDLLIVYLEEVPDFDENLAEMFGGGAQKFTDEDFRERAEKVLQALEGKLKAEPDLSIELLALCVLNRGNNQLSLHRRLRAADVVGAARSWEAAVKNAPKVTVRFPEAKKDELVAKTYYTPDPLDIASMLNRLWSEDAICGETKPAFQRAVSVSDAYDVFLAAGPVAYEKTKQCLAVLIARMSVPLSRLGTVKASDVWIKDGRPTIPAMLRLHCSKAVSLLGIFLQRLEHRKDRFMNEPIYHVGRLLALADSLHCR
jgi:hypothetical protein